MNQYEHSTNIDIFLHRIRANEPKAKEELISHSMERLQKLSRRMFRKFPKLRTLEETDDVVQKLVIRLHKMLSELIPSDTASYFRLASQNISWVLKDLARSSAAKYKPKNSGDLASTTQREGLLNTKDPNGGPASFAEWADFYEKIEQLPDENLQIFDLLWFQGLSQEDAAKILNMPLRTLARKWMITRVLIKTLLNNQLPEHGDQ